MKSRRDLDVIAVLSVVIALALIVFPEWVAVHPVDDLTMPLGHAWILSPPAPPDGLSGMRVEPRWSLSIFFAIAALASGTMIFLIRPKTK